MTFLEAAVQYVADVLIGAETAAGDRVHRHQVDEVEADAGPQIVVRRGGASKTSDTLDGTPTYDLQVIVHCLVTGPRWETEADALQEQVHGALTEDGQLLETDLQLLSIEPTQAAGDPIVGELICTYQLTLSSDQYLTTGA